MSATASVSRTVYMAIPVEQAYAALIDPDRYDIWCTLHRSWSERPERLDSMGTCTETIAILDQDTLVSWTVDSVGEPNTAVRRGEGQRNLQVTMSLAAAEPVPGLTSATVTAEFSSPAFDDDAAAQISAWTAQALELSVARLEDVISGSVPRETLDGPDTETLIDGLGFTECPRWHDGQLYFVDMVQKRVLRLEADGTTAILATVAGTPGGLGWLPDGTLLVVSQDDGKILCVQDGQTSLHADLSPYISSPLNDMWVGPDGRAYVGEMGFNVHALLQQSGEPVEIKPGALLVAEPDGSVQRVAEDVGFPNGIVLSHDGKTLYVAESLRSLITAFDVGPGGQLSSRRTHAELSHPPDGIAVDRDGNLWFATPAGKLAFRIAPDGTVVDHVVTQLDCIAVGLGGDDGQTLFCCTSPTNNHAEAAILLGSKVETVRIKPVGQ